MSEAVPVYRQARDRFPDDPVVLNNLGAAYFKLNDDDNAERYLQQAVVAEPNHARAHTTLGLLMERAGSRDEAREFFQKALDRAPDEPYTQVARMRLEADSDPRSREPLILELISGA